MKHFDEKDWLKYCKSDSVGYAEKEMEQHLLDCDLCLALYLKAIESLEFENAKKNIPLEFTENVITQIQKTSQQDKQNKTRIKLILYYTTAACITIFLTFSGAFQLFERHLPNAAESITHTPSALQHFVSNGWTDRLLNKTTIFLDTLKP